MKISTGEAEQHPNVLPLNPQPAPDPVTPRFPSGPQQGAVRDLAGERLSALAASEAECAAAQSYGMGADGDRRTGYAADMLPLAAEYGDLMGLPDVVSDMSKHTGSPGSPDVGPAG